MSGAAFYLAPPNGGLVVGDNFRPVFATAVNSGAFVTDVRVDVLARKIGW